MFNFKKLLSIFFPMRCPFCNEVISSNEKVCKNCAKKIKPKTIKNVLTTRSGKNFICVSPFDYIEPIRSAIHEYKFHGAKGFAITFGKYIVDILTENFDLSKIDLITSVPLHKIRKRERGFNQSEIFAREVSELTGIKYVEALKKVKKNKIQHELNLSERTENVKNVYLLEGGVELRGKVVIICDDILTTGNTMAECANVIFEAGAKEVIGVTIANVAGKSKKSTKNCDFYNYIMINKQS